MKVKHDKLLSSFAFRFNLRLSSTVGRLGAHVRHVYARENRFTGDLAAALGGARDLETLDVAHNRLSGDLGAALAGADPAVASTLRELHVEGNALTDTESRPVVRGVLSKTPSLRSYDISVGRCKLNARLLSALETGM
jgi:hypothetical protein